MNHILSEQSSTHKTRTTDFVSAVYIRQRCGYETDTSYRFRVRDRSYMHRAIVREMATSERGRADETSPVSTSHPVSRPRITQLCNLGNAVTSFMMSPRAFPIAKAAFPSRTLFLRFPKRRSTEPYLPRPCTVYARATSNSTAKLSISKCFLHKRSPGERVPAL